MERKYKVIDYNTFEVNGIKIKRVDELPADNVEIGNMKDDYGVYSKIAAKENAFYNKNIRHPERSGWVCRISSPTMLRRT